MLTACLFASPLVAEIIGNVEYQLPKAGWKVANEINTEKDNSKTIIYAPENCTEENKTEGFGVHSNSISNENLDQTSLSKTLLPKATKTNIIEQDPQSVLFEWSFGEGKTAIQGLIRGFSSAQGSVMLFYTAEGDHFAANRDIWLKTLKEAKQVQ
jgi:hypothetical protein